MSRSGRRAALAALFAALSPGSQAALFAQEPAAAAQAAPAPPVQPGGPRLAPAMRRVEPVLEERAEPAYAPMKKKDTTVITISTVGLIIIVVLLLVLLI